MTKIIALFTVLFVTSCAAQVVDKEVVKSAKAKAASDRINSSAGNSKDTLKDLDD